MILNNLNVISDTFYNIFNKNFLSRFGKIKNINNLFFKLNIIGKTFNLWNEGFLKKIIFDIKYFIILF